MNCWSTLVSALKQEWRFFCWQDFLEIGISTWGIYQFLCWLSCDKQKNLVFYFYAYCGLSCAAYYLNLATLCVFLFSAAPFALLLFIMFHQHTLQKNFITLKNITPKAEQSYHWLEIVMQQCLALLNQNREVLCIIERTDHLQNFLTSTCTINAFINRELLTLATTPTVAHQPLVLWINHTGTLVTANPLWHVPLDEAWVSDELKTIESWKQDALFITEKSDALIFALTPTHRLATVIVEGKNIPAITPGQAFALIKKYLNTKTQKDTTHAPLHNKSSTQQDSPQN